MAKGAGVNVKGLKELKAHIGSIAKELVEEIDPLMAKAAKDFANRAINAAPRDEGILIQGIGSYKEKDLSHAVYSSSFQSAFMEWGTRRRTKIPADLVQYAAAFKGKKGGDGQGFYDSILAWVKRKGIAATQYNVKSRRRSGNKVDNQIADEQAAFAIYLSIIRNGIHPKPFFFQHRDAIYKQLLQDIKEQAPKALEK